MIKRIVGTTVAVVVLGLSLSTLAAGNGGGSHGGGNGGGNSGSHGGMNNTVANAKAPQDADSTSHKGAKEAHTEKTPSQQLAANKKLSETLAHLLPAGTDLQAASVGFRNLGQFVAAVHASKNLGVPLADLKAKMMNGASLGAAIKTLKPEANAELESEKARKQAAQDTAAT